MVSLDKGEPYAVYDEHGLTQTLFPAILMANIHGHDWDIHMTGILMDKNMVYLNLSSKKIVM